MICVCFAPKLPFHALSNWIYWSRAIEVSAPKLQNQQMGAKRSFKNDSWAASKLKVLKLKYLQDPAGCQVEAESMFEATKQAGIRLSAVR